MIREGVNLYFSDPRLMMSPGGRFLVRFISYFVYAILIAACAIFLLADIKWIFWSGVLLLLFLSERLINLNKGERSLQQKKLMGDVNLAKYLSPSAFMAVEYSFERASVLGGSFCLFLLKRLINGKNIKTGLIRMGINPVEFLNKVDDALGKSLKNNNNSGSKEDRKNYLLAEVQKIVGISLEEAFSLHNGFIDPANIFTALSYCDNPDIVRIFQFFNIEQGDLENALIFSRFNRGFGLRNFLPANLGGFARNPYKNRHRIMNRAWSARPTPMLDKYSEDLTDYAREESIGFLIGHRNEYDRMIDVLSRPGRPNVLLNGEPGSGKDTMVEHLAFRIAKDEVPPELFDKRLVKLRLGNIVAGADQSEFQARLKKIIEEIIQAGNVVLYIPDIHNLLKTSAKGIFNALDTFLPTINSSVFSLIGTTYPKEYKQTIEPQSDFTEAFEVIRVEEISPADATRILVYESIILERQFRIMITFGAVKQAVALAHKYFRDKLLPSSARELLKEAISNARDRKVKVLTSDDVINIAQRRVDIPLKQARADEARKLLNLESIIHERLIDQEEAVSAVSRSLREYRSGLARKGGPIAAFLFVGPTGVGKTELSKIIANIQFGSKDAMIRFDMSEYQDKQSIFRFIGSPDGTMSGSLTDAVLAKPYSLVLLDEFEKAHPDILNLFLQVFDDGRLTDNFGRIADFQNTIIIATSNAHSDFIKTEIENGRAMTEISDNLKKKLTEYFRPELINRFSDIIVFKNLSPDDIISVTSILLKDLSDEVKQSQQVELVFSGEAVKEIARLGYDPVFGARPLRGVISEKIRSVLAEKILKNEIVKGSKISVETENNNLVFNAGQI